MRPSRPTLRWLGGKFRLADFIIAHFPPHDIYVEPYGGAFSVGLAKPRAYNEVYGDLDGELVNLFRVLRSDDSGELLRLLSLTPYARAEYELALQPADTPVERARRMIVRSHMAHGTGVARLDRVTGFRRDGCSGTTNVAGEWAALPDALQATVDRLRGVTIEQRPALDLLKYYDDPKALIYLDPPYVPDTRSSARKGGEGYHVYAHEMTIDDHIEMLDACRCSRAMIVLSGYATALYDEALADWTRRTVAARAFRNARRTEVIWINPAASAAMSAPSLFDRAVA